ncbi:MAG: 50S ribosomal protein L13 [bacterium]
MKIERKIHKFDATDKILGRLATEVAVLLRGKGKVDFTPNIDNGDFVQVTNADKIKVTGNKLVDKLYRHHSGYPGGLKSKSLKKMMEDSPTEVIRVAVYGMLPKNKTRDVIMQRLTIK